MSEAENPSQNRKQKLIAVGITAAVFILVALSAVAAALLSNFDGAGENTEPPGSSSSITASIPEASSQETSVPGTADPIQTGSMPTNPDNIDIDWDIYYSFREVDETVTAKEETRLRDIPSQGEGSEILFLLKNGEVAKRIGISDYGWSKLEYNGMICYAVSSYLTTDLTPPKPVIQTRFTEVNEQVTAKELVNLRSLPSVTNEDSEIIAQLRHGEVITRTGINTDVGWSRVKYNGQTLYCVSSYLMNAEDLTAPTEGSTSTTE